MTVSSLPAGGLITERKVARGLVTGGFRAGALFVMGVDRIDMSLA
jgi:hypothetical protein